MTGSLSSWFKRLGRPKSKEEQELEELAEEMQRLRERLEYLPR